MKAINKIYQKAKERLHMAGIDGAAYDAACIFTKHTGRKKQDDFSIDKETEQKIMLDIEKRATHYPLQYILGEWEFMGLPFLVGEGVLIPRQDTEILCETAIEALKQQSNPSILDLCSGSGCIAISITHFVKSAKVTALEYSDIAIEYIEKNRDLNQVAERLTILHENMLCPENIVATFEAILSNPPYIPASDIAGLQLEVGFEPRMALDGGEDGLTFYRAICEIWLPFLKKDGFVAVEIGAKQEKDVETLFVKHGLRDIQIIKDYGGINRVVMGWK